MLQQVTVTFPVRHDWSLGITILKAMTLGIGSIQTLTDEVILRAHLSGVDGAGPRRFVDWSLIWDDEKWEEIVSRAGRERAAPRWKAILVIM